MIPKEISVECYYYYFGVWFINELSFFVCVYFLVEMAIYSLSGLSMAAFMRVMLQFDRNSLKSKALTDKCVTQKRRPRGYLSLDKLYA